MNKCIQLWNALPNMQHMMFTEPEKMSPSENFISSLAVNFCLNQTAAKYEVVLKFTSVWCLNGK